MTLIVGLRCEEGLVLASDSQATAASSGQPTKDDVQKLYVLDGTIGWAGSGAAGLIQRADHALRELSKLHHTFRSNGREAGAAKVLVAVNQLQHQAAKEFVPGTGEQQATLECLLAGFAKDGPFLLEITKGGTRQFYTTPYAAIGSGDIFALHAMRSVAHYDLSKLTLDCAKALAYRTVDNAIKTAAYFLGGKVQLLAVTMEGARCLNDDEMKPVQDLVDIWKQKEVEALGSLSRPADAAPEPELAGEPPKE